MERVIGSKSLAVAALVSLMIHGGIFFAYAFVFKDVEAFKSYQPLMVALIPTTEMEEPAALPLAVVKEERAHVIKADQNDALIPADLINDREGAPPTVRTLSAKAVGEVAAQQTKDQRARDLTTPSLPDQNVRLSPEFEATTGSGAAIAYLPAAGEITSKTMASGINSPGAPNVASSGGEMSSLRYARLDPLKGGALTLAAPRYSENYLPAYPLSARRRGYAGVVMLSVEVLADGSVGHLEMKKTSGYDLLDKSAQETVKGWKFLPGKKMGTPVTMWVDVPVRFELN